MRKIMLLIAFLGLIGMQGFAQKTITGTVTSADDGSAIPGASVVVKGTSIATVTDINGKYVLKNVPDDAKTLVFSFMGMETQEVAISGDVVDCALKKKEVEVGQVVVTALGIKRSEKTLTYAAQNVKSDELDVAQPTNVKDALAGKVAGIQNVGQAGSKLGASGKIRIRGAISLTADADPLYVVDGVPVSDPNVIDVNDIASINVLKGPNATALYGQRAEYGVIMITTKSAQNKGVSVEINSSATFDHVAYMPNYQNKYGAGYDGEDEWMVYDTNAFSLWQYWSPWKDPAWDVFQGKKFIVNGYADESWGPAFSDTVEYVPWYAWWPESPYYGQTAKWVAQPNNIKDFYNVGKTFKNSVAVNANGENYNARISFTNTKQEGIIPYSWLKKNNVSAKLSYSPTDKLSVNLFVSYASTDVQGDFDDGYANQVTGSFNQWFNRNLEMDKLKELKDLKTTHGYHASWNWWNPYFASILGYLYGRDHAVERPAFWYNPYFWLENYKNENHRAYFISNFSIDYNITKCLTFTAGASMNYTDAKNHYELPYVISYSADPDLYNVWNNGFGNTNITAIENNYFSRLTFKKKFGDFDVDAFVGANLRYNSYNRFSANMPIDSKTQGLVLPDVFTYNNAKQPVTARTYLYEKKVASIYGRASIGYKNMAYLDMTIRRDWSSALPVNHNGYTYPSVGLSFIFTELLPKNDYLTFGKLRMGWAQVGNDVAALALNPVYPTSGTPYYGNVLMYTNSTMVDPNIVPALNTSIEAGIDLRLLKNRASFSFTYFDETRKDEIIPVALSYSTGYSAYLTNAGLSRRNGMEIELGFTPVKSKNFEWNLKFNWGKSYPKILELPEGLDAMAAPGGGDEWDNVSVVHELGNKWGQLRGSRILRDSATGKYVVNSATGLYQAEQGYYFGSVLPDFTGGIFTSMTIMNMLTITATIDYQKGGKFFSQSEWWGNYTGILAETAADNDNGIPVRDSVNHADPTKSGGVHVVGVDENGDPFDQYVEADPYFRQFVNNGIAEPFVHNADYIKLRELNVSFNVPKNWLPQKYVKTLSVGFVGRNLWFKTAKDNVHHWDPSELSHSYGENAQLPGIKSYGFNLRITF